MVRRFVAMFSATGVMISVTLWVLSYAQPVFRFHHPHTFIVRYGCIAAGHAYFVGLGHIGPADIGPDRTPWVPYANFHGGSGGSLEFHWLVWIPLWIPTLLSSLIAWRSAWPLLRRRRRAKLGLCLCCGYDLRGSINRCPECGREFRSSGVQDLRI